MPTPLRFVHDDFKVRPAQGDPVQVVELTARTIGGRFLLRPDPRATELILGVIGRAQALYDVDIYAFHVLSNHMSLLIGVTDATQQARFADHVMGNIAREIGRLRRWRERIWARRNRAINVVDDAAQVDRLVYCLSNATKENLVARPDAWPGPHSAKLHCRGEDLIGKWIDRTALFRARQQGKDVTEDDFTTEYEVQLSKLPIWSALDDDAYAAKIRELCDEIAREAADERQRTGRKLFGANRSRRMDPHHVPNKIDRSPAPLVHASTKKKRKLFRDTYREFVEAYQTAIDRLRQGLADFDFPEGGVLPTLCPPEPAAPG